jgi:hypothetical protein
MPTKVIAGRVNADGTVQAGSGFFLRPLGDGIYLVEFDQSLEAIPTVVIKENWRNWNDFEFENGDSRDNAVLVAVDQKGFKLITGDSTGTKVDRNFSFIAAAASSQNSIPDFVWGNIGKDAVVYGSSLGFDCHEFGAGVYVINFNPSFNELASVVVTPNHPKWNDFGSAGGNTIDNAVIVAANNSTVKYITGDSTGTKVDRNCSFVAVGQCPGAAVPRLLFGNVKKDGNVFSEGSGGYIVGRTGTGTYEIGFINPFSAPAAVLLTENFPNWSDFEKLGGKTLDNCIVVAVDETRVKVITGDSTGAKVDRNFGFLAVGP